MYLMGIVAMFLFCDDWVTRMWVGRKIDNGVQFCRVRNGVSLGVRDGPYCPKY